MNLVIHRGTHEIGGSCVELHTNNKRVIIDIGVPLLDSNGKSCNLGSYHNFDKTELLEKGIITQGIYDICKWNKDTKSIDAVLISHSHPDHYGLLPLINTQTPLYLSKGCLNLVKAAFYLKKLAFNFEAKIIKDREPFTIGDFRITPYLVDHSGFDAFSFLIEAEGQRIFYSGDFRAHGRKHTLYEKLIKDPPKDIHYLILEGTKIEEGSGTCKTEEALRDELVKHFKRSKGLIFFACSSQNIDRICSLYSACLRSSRTLVFDPYTAFLLDTIKESSSRIPQFDWENIRIFFTPDSNTKRLREDKTLFKYKRAKISYKELEEKKDSLVIKTSYGTRRAFVRKGFIENSTLIYSMWSNYFKDESSFWENYGISPIYIHTSGHADRRALKIFADAMNPQTIIPIHTSSPEKYIGFFDNKVKILADGEQIEL